jgi:CO/xanthine dehydrogenase FAD-binding subunit
MKPPQFEYVAPRTQDEALALLAEHGERAKVLAGGQSLIPLLNFRLIHPDVLIDLNRVSELAYVRDRDGGVAIGALTRQRALERSEAIRSRLPIVAEACRFIGHVPIRHRGTVGGNLAHADPASELPAVMLALDAEFVVVAQRGPRTLSAAEFFRGALTTSLAPGELLAEIRVPGLPVRTGAAFLEMARRAGDFALVGVAALVTLDGGGRCERARVALCGVGATPIRASQAERVLHGETPRGAVLDAAAELAAAATDPPTDLHGSSEFRRKLARYFTRQALEIAAERAGGA